MSSALSRPGSFPLGVRSTPSVVAPGDGPTGGGGHVGAMTLTFSEAAPPTFFVLAIEKGTSAWISTYVSSGTSTLFPFANLNESVPSSTWKTSIFRLLTSAGKRLPRGTET